MSLNIQRIGYSPSQQNYDFKSNQKQNMGFGNLQTDSAAKLKELKAAEEKALNFLKSINPQSEEYLDLARNLNNLRMEIAKLGG